MGKKTVAVGSFYLIGVSDRDSGKVIKGIIYRGI
jgi:hypothetical protein